MHRFIFLLIFLSIPGYCFATDCGDADPDTFCLTESWDVAEAESVISAAVAASSSPKIYWPAGDVTITTTIDGTFNSNTTVEFIGNGIGSTIIRQNTGSTDEIFHMAFPQGDVSPNTSTFIMHGFSFQGNQSTGVSQALYLYGADVINIYENYWLDSRWSGPLLFKGVTSGVIHNNTIYCTVETSDDKGIYFSGNQQSLPSDCTYNAGSHTSCSAATCDTYFTQELGTTGCDTPASEWCADCGQTWLDWWNNSDVNNGVGWDDNWTPGSTSAVYIENNELHNTGPIVHNDWGARQQIVIRYNDCYQHPSGGNLVPTKPGLMYAEIYNNNFYSSGTITGMNIGTLRTNGVLYNNRFFDATKITSTDVNSYFCFNGYCYPDKILFDEMYVWGNLTYSEQDDSGSLTPTDPGCGDINSLNCFNIAVEGSAEDRARISGDIANRLFHRAPTTGDRIYSGNPSLPVDQGACPNTLTGLGTSCDNTKYGKDGYGTGGGSPNSSVSAGSSHSISSGSTLSWGAQ